MKFVLQIIIFFSSAILVNGQGRNFTIQEVVINLYHSLAAENFEQITLISNSEDLLCTNGSKLLKIDETNRKREVLLKKTELIPNSTEELGNFHDVNCNWNNTIHLYEKISNYFFDNL